MTKKQEQALIDAVREAYYHLSRDGIYTSESNWRVMMRKLERAWNVTEKVIRKEAAK